MRKQDRVANEQQSRSPMKEHEQNREPREREQMKGETEREPARQPRQPGSKLPLPD